MSTITELLRSAFHRLKRSFTYAKLNGHMCSCGTVVAYFPYICKGVVNKHNFYVQNITEEVICPRCLHSRIERYYLKASKFDLRFTKCEITDKVDWCSTNIIGYDTVDSETDDTANRMGLILNFGTELWDNPHTSLSAFETVLMKTGSIHSIAYNDVDHPPISVQSITYTDRRTRPRK